MRFEVNQPPVHLLFVCSRNLWRSPTAEALCRNLPGFESRSAGTEPSARRQVSANLLTWADQIFCTERRHVTRLRERFGPALAGRQIVCLDIPDDYPFMDAELVEWLKVALSEHLPALCAESE